MHICVFSPTFPTKKTIDFVFVEQLCRAFADLGNEVTVVAPQSLTKCLFRGVPIVAKKTILKTSNNNSIRVIRPFVITVGNSPLNNLFHAFNTWNVNRALSNISYKPDVCYGHFWSSIYSLYPFAKKNNIPLFGASGEENVEYYIRESKEFCQEVKEYLKGVVSVSSKNQGECISMNLVDSDKSIVIPNAINNTLFYKRDKSEMRQKYGFEAKDFIVAFTGQFVPRKGTLRLSEALSKLNDPSIKAIFMGRGSEIPTYKGTLLKGTVLHDQLPEYLSCADVFVLPTENEGCSNAIIEAMACGLPIISTDAPFNYDILNENNSIMIDCHNIAQISDAIKKIKDNKCVRARLSKGAIDTASNLSIEKRAQNIINFINEKI